MQKGNKNDFTLLLMQLCRYVYNMHVADMTTEL